MYAIIQTGGKQYRVTSGQTLAVEKLPGEVGHRINFTEVLMLVDGGNYHIGSPFVAQAKVTAEVLGETRGPKVDIIKLKRRKHHIKHMGHRQDYTTIKISDIFLGDMKLSPAEKKTVKTVGRKTLQKESMKSSKKQTKQKR